MSTPGDGVLLADIGGTNARFALWVADDAGNGRIQKMHTLPTTGFATTENALDELAAQIDLSGLKAALFAIAGPVDGAAARLVNADWNFDLGSLRSRLDVPVVRLINDFAAIGYAVPDLGEDMVQAIGSGGLPDRTKGPVLVIGPGTGMGLCIYVKDGDSDIVLPTEGGHATLAAFSRGQAEVLNRLQATLGHVCVEQVVSGSGLVRLYEAVAGAGAKNLQPADVTARAVERADPLCRKAVELFLGFLAGVAGNAALMAGTTGGVIIAGGIVPRLNGLFDETAFRAGFEAKGDYAGYMAAIPTGLVTYPDPAFIGLARLAPRLLADASL